VSPPDAAGIAGVLMILAAYAGATSGKLDPKRPIALSLNLFGAGLILLSLAYDFNLSAFLMEAAWAVVALIGLVRFALRR
jgi:hypothetical protein